MKLRNLLLFACFAALCGATPVITVVPALGPNGYGSPSYNNWAANAVAALYADAATAGTPNTPEYYQRVSGGAVSGSDILVTSFNSWMGSVDPGSVYGPAFANELGNRIMYGVQIIGSDSSDLFSISQMSFTLESTDPANALGFSFGAGSYGYSTQYQGVLYGANNMLGGGDDTFITGGPNTQLVNAIIGRGSGNALWPCAAGDPNPCGTNAEKQAAMDYWAAYNGSPYEAIGTYRLNLPNSTVSGTATVTINPDGESTIPEPSTFVSLGAGGLFLLIGRMRRKRQ